MKLEDLPKEIEHEGYRWSNYAWYKAGEIVHISYIKGAPIYKHPTYKECIQHLLAGGAVKETDCKGRVVLYKISGQGDLSYLSDGICHAAPFDGFRLGDSFTYKYEFLKE